jgi:hypothetical protein
LVLGALAGCDDSAWPGPGSDPSQLPRSGGDPSAPGAHFGSWVNNAYGDASTIIPVFKDHPPLAGATVCVDEAPGLPCAVSDAGGRFDLYGLPITEPVHLRIALPGYYSLLIPYDGAQGDFIDQPALEIPSDALSEVMYQQLLVAEDRSKGGISFMLVDSPELHADPAAGDHHEANGLLAGVAVRYRRVDVHADGSESYGGWSNPRSYTLGHQVVYLDTNESPDIAAMHTSGSGLALAVNVAPGLYEVEADDTNLIGGWGTWITGHHYTCAPVRTMPVGSSAPRARVRVIARHLSDVRMYCVTQ